jgi:hypothetical protein
MASFFYNPNALHGIKDTANNPTQMQYNVTTKTILLVFLQYE